MKNENEKDEYRYLKNRLIGQLAGMMLLAGAVIIGLYNFLLKGHFANITIGFIDHFILHDYDAAYVAFQRIFRNNMELFFLAAVLIVFFALVTVFISSFSRYFKEINNGIDFLLEDGAGTVNLSPELAPVEKKINSVKSTLVQQRTEIQAAEQRKNDLIMYLAHDLKTPLASVIGYLNLLRDEGQIAEELREKYLSITLDKAERLEDLINEFFEITRFHLSDITLQYSRIDLTRLLEQLVYEFTPMLREKHLTCRLHAADELMFRCDADKMQRVFDNLLRNAVLYSFDHTEIELFVTQERDSVVIKFVNRGDTIPQEKLDRIFEQFYRLDSARSTKSGGAGLGLAIAKQIVELHGGTITAHSEDETIAFTVTLPGDAHVEICWQALAREFAKS